MLSLLRLAPAWLIDPLGKYLGRMALGIVRDATLKDERGSGSS